MINWLFSGQGRIGRGSFWKGLLLLMLVGFAASALAVWLGASFKTGNNGELSFDFNTSGSIPATIVFLAYTIAATWAGVCLGIKRFHDRNKAGAWVLIQFVPIIGPIWYFVEAGCLAGTPGPNRFGLAGGGTLPDGAIAAF